METFYRAKDLGHFQTPITLPNHEWLFFFVKRLELLVHGKGPLREREILYAYFQADYEEGVQEEIHEIGAGPRLCNV